MDSEHLSKHKGSNPVDSSGTTINMDDLMGHKENLPPRKAGYKTSTVLGAGSHPESHNKVDILNKDDQVEQETNKKETMIVEYKLPSELVDDPRRKKFENDLDFHRYMLERDIRHLDEKNSTDPLEVYYKYSKFLEDNYANGHPNFMKIIEKCARKFRADRKYSNDKRFLWMWLHVASRAQEPIEVFKYCSINNLFCDLPKFYEQYSALLLINKRYDESEEILNLAIQRNVHPIERLKNKLIDLKAKRKVMEEQDSKQKLIDTRAAVRDARDNDKMNFNNNNTSRPGVSNSNLNSRMTASINGPVLAPVSIDHIGGFSQTNNNNNNVNKLQNNVKLNIHNDKDENNNNNLESELLPKKITNKWNDFGSTINNKKENIREPSKWTGETLPQNNHDRGFLNRRNNNNGSVFDQIPEFGSSSSYNNHNHNNNYQLQTSGSISVFKDEEIDLIQSKDKEIKKSNNNVLKEKHLSERKLSLTDISIASTTNNNTATTLLQKRPLQKDNDSDITLTRKIPNLDIRSIDGHKRKSSVNIESNKSILTNTNIVDKSHMPYLTRLKKNENMMCNLEEVYQIIPKENSDKSIINIEMEFSFEEILSQKQKYSFITPPKSIEKVNNNNNSSITNNNEEFNSPLDNFKKNKINEKEDEDKDKDDENFNNPVHLKYAASPTINTKAASLDVFEMFNKPLFNDNNNENNEQTINNNQNKNNKNIIEVETDETISGKVFKRNLAGSVFNNNGGIFVDDDTITRLDRKIHEIEKNRLINFKPILQDKNDKHDINDENANENQEIISNTPLKENNNNTINSSNNNSSIDESRSFVGAFNNRVLALSTIKPSANKTNILTEEEIQLLKEKDGMTATFIGEDTISPYNNDEKEDLIIDSTVTTLSKVPNILPMVENSNYKYDDNSLSESVTMNLINSNEPCDAQSTKIIDSIWNKVLYTNDFNIALIDISTGDEPKDKKNKYNYIKFHKPRYSYVNRDFNKINMINSKKNNENDTISGGLNIISKMYGLQSQPEDDEYTIGGSHISEITFIKSLNNKDINSNVYLVEYDANETFNAGSYNLIDDFELSFDDDDNNNIKVDKEVDIKKIIIKEESDVANKNLIVLKVSERDNEPYAFLEYLIINSLRSKISEKSLSSIVIPVACEVTMDEVLLTTRFHRRGSLLDICKMSSKFGFSGIPGSIGLESSINCLNEALAIFFLVEIMRVVDDVQSVGVIHNNIKPENVLLRLAEIPSLNWDSSFRIDRSGGWSKKGIVLCDWKRSIDLSLFVKGKRFIFGNDYNNNNLINDHTLCIEMRKKLPIRYEQDWYGIANIAHVLLFGKSISVKESETKKPIEVNICGKVETIPYLELKEDLKSNWNIQMWQEFFNILMNVGYLYQTDPSTDNDSYEHDFPPIHRIRAIRRSMEQWLVQSTSGRNLRGLVKRIEAAAEDFSHR